MDIDNINNEYIINKYSKLIFILSLLISILIVPFFGVLVNKNVNFIIIYFGFLLSGFLFFKYIPKITSKEIINIKFDYESIKIRWIKKFWFNSIKEDIEFNINDINTYKYEPSNNFDTFKIDLKNGKKFKIHRWYLDTNDDFEKFYKDFEKIIKLHNKKSNQSIIIRNQNLMENKPFLFFLAIFLIIIIIVSVYFIMTKGINNPKGIIPILVVFSSLIWLIHNIINGLNDK